MTAAFRDEPFASWGRIERASHQIAHPRHMDELPALLGERRPGSILAVGAGRSYGDSGLNRGGALLDMRGLDRVISFDRTNGILRAQAGLTLDALLRIVVPHGWFTATTPGTRFVTLGGAVANDVHGKNHHAAGAFGCSVRALGLLRSNGSAHVLERDSGGDLFRATIAGLGLTGIITWVEIDLVRISSAWVDNERIPFTNVNEFFRLASETGDRYEHTVAWIDCASRGNALGRGIFQRANWSVDGGLALHSSRLGARMPVDAPSGLLNGASVRAFNALYYRLEKFKTGRQREHYGTFFYPLDAIGDWNRLYGRPGFYQYQCVIPPSEAEPAVTEMVRQIANAGAGSFLAVLKTLGNRMSPGYLSFPRPGATLALDFPNRGRWTLDRLARLDSVVREAGGRLYPAKDGRMPAAMFQAGYADGLPAFKAQVDPGCSSDFWRRVAA